MKSLRILCIMTLLVVALKAELIHRYRFDGASGNLDSVGQLHAEESKLSSVANMQGVSPTYISGAPSGNVKLSPKTCMALQSSGNLQKFKIDITLNPSGTICFWEKSLHTMGTNDKKTILHQNTWDGLYVFNVKGQAKLSLQKRIINSNSFPVFNSVNNDWAFVALSWTSLNANDKKANVYYNGQVVGTDSTSDPWSNIASLNTSHNSFAKPILFGNMESGSSINLQYYGYIYDIQFYDEYIPKEGLDELMANPGATYPLPKTALFKFE